MTQIIKPAAFAAATALASAGQAPKRSQLGEILAALLGYQTYAALATEEAIPNMAHLDDAEILVLDQPSAEKRAMALGVADAAAVVQACIEALRGAVHPDISVFVGVDDFYDSHARDKMTQEVSSSDNVSGAMAETNASFDDDPEMEQDTPATEDLWQAREYWDIAATGTWVGSYYPEDERVFSGDTLHCSAKLSYAKAGRAGLTEIGSEAYASADGNWADEDYEAEQEFEADSKGNEA
jgi:hypothetical protein